MTGHDRRMVLVLVLLVALVLAVPVVARSAAGVSPAELDPGTTTAVPPPATEAPATTVASVPTSSSTTTTTEAGADDRRPVLSTDRAAVEDVTRRFAAVWLTPQATRLNHLAEVATIDFAPQVAEVPDDVLPKATFASVLDVQIDGGQAYVTGALTDGTRFRVAVVTTALGWRVAALDEG
jgi:hypothetical protein